jgi:hypothetical protein
MVIRNTKVSDCLFTSLAIVGVDTFGECSGADLRDRCCEWLKAMKAKPEHLLAI